MSWGATPHRSDTRRTEALRWLGQLQNLSGANPENNPRRTDTYRRILYKIARATSESETVVVACVSPAPVLVQIFGSSPAADWEWTLASDPAQDFLLKWGTVSGGPYDQSEAVNAANRNYGTVALPGDYFGVVVARDSDDCVSDESNELPFTIT